MLQFSSTNIINSCSLFVSYLHFAGKLLAQCYTFKYFFGNRGQTFDKMLIILSDDRKMKTGIKDMWIKIKCQCCQPSQKCSCKSWFMICQFLSPFMQWVVVGWWLGCSARVTDSWTFTELQNIFASCGHFNQEGRWWGGAWAGYLDISQYGQRSSWEPRAILWTK